MADLRQLADDLAVLRREAAALDDGEISDLLVRTLAGVEVLRLECMRLRQLITGGGTDLRERPRRAQHTIEPVPGQGTVTHTFSGPEERL